MLRRRWSAGVEALGDLVAHEQLDRSVELALEPCRASSRASRRRSSRASMAICACRSTSRSVTRSSRSVWRRSHSTSTTSSRARTSVSARSIESATAASRARSLSVISSIDRRRSSVCASSSSSASVTACPATRSSSSRRRTTVLRCSSAVDPARRTRSRAGLHLGDREAVPLPEVRQLGFEVALRPIEVLREGAEAVFEPALGAGELLGKRLSRVPFPLGERRPALLAEPALLRGEDGGGLCALARDHALDLLCLSGGLRRDRLAHGLSGLGDELRGGGRRGARLRSATHSAATSMAAETRRAARIQTATPPG